MVRLRHNLSNPKLPLLRLFAELEVQSSFKPSEIAHDAVIAQTGAADPSKVRLQIKENRKLSPAQITELADAYSAGASQRALSLRFGIHEQTVRAHLKRRDVTIRPVCALVEWQEYEVARLYTEEVWSLDELAVRFKTSSATIRNVLVRHSIPRRSRARRPSK